MSNSTGKVSTNNRLLIWKKTLPDPSKNVVLSVYSCYEELGGCLLQGQPIAYASRSLNKAERNYDQIEKELLAVVFGCTLLRQFVYEYTCGVITSH
jgi:hypothetical protein